MVSLLGKHWGLAPTYQETGPEQSGGQRRIETLEGEKEWWPGGGTAWTKAQHWPEWATAQEKPWIVRPPCVLLWELVLSQNKIERKTLISLLWPAEEVPALTSDGIQFCLWQAVLPCRSHFTSLRLSCHTYSKNHSLHRSVEIRIQWDTVYKDLIQNFSTPFSSDSSV